MCFSFKYKYIDRGRWIMIWAICMQEGTPRFISLSAAGVAVAD